MIKFKSCNLRVGKEHYKPLIDVHLELDLEAIQDGKSKLGADEVAKDIGKMILKYIEKEQSDYDPLEVE